MFGCCLFSCCSFFPVFWHEKHWKGRFQPVFGAHSTQTLVKIFNHYSLLLEVWYFHTHKTSLTTTVNTSNGQLSCLLCISTSKRVLCTPFAGWNQFFDAKTTFCVLISHKLYKITQKNPGFKGVYQRLGVTLKHWFTPKSWLIDSWAKLFIMFCLWRKKLF